MIRPVDLQMLVPKSAEVNRVNHDEARRPEIAHQHFSQELNKQVTHNQQQVVHTNKSEKQEVQRDGSNKNKRKERNKKQKKQDTKDMDNNLKVKSSSMFDYSI